MVPDGLNNVGTKSRKGMEIYISLSLASAALMYMYCLEMNVVSYVRHAGWLHELGCSCN